MRYQLANQPKPFTAAAVNPRKSRRCFLKKNSQRGTLYWKRQKKKNHKVFLQHCSWGQKIARGENICKTFLHVDPVHRLWGLRGISFSSSAVCWTGGMVTSTNGSSINILAFKHVDMHLEPGSKVRNSSRRTVLAWTSRVFLPGRIFTPQTSAFCTLVPVRRASKLDTTVD